MEETYKSFGIEMILDIPLTFILVIEGITIIALIGSGYLVYWLYKKIKINSQIFTFKLKYSVNNFLQKSIFINCYFSSYYNKYNN